MKTKNLFFYIIGMSSTLARHFGYLFMRDPLVIIKEQLYPTDDQSTYHFEVSFNNILIIRIEIFFMKI